MGPTIATWMAAAMLTAAAALPVRADYGDIVTADNPVAYWRLDSGGGDRAINHAPGDNPAALDGVPRQVTLGQPGPRPPRFTDFTPDNTAAAFAAGQRIVIADPGDASVLDFDKGDSITLEAWVRPTSVDNEQQVYVIGKGRTNNPGVAANNQNWALRLRGVNGVCKISFLFRGARNRPGTDAASSRDWHRWNSGPGFAASTGWHHVAVTYTFGKSASIRGYIDGQAVDGAWDYGGATDEAPVVDNDEVWIGSSMGGGANSTFAGLIDEVAVYRTALSPDRVKAHFTVDPKIAPPAPAGPGSVALGDVPEGAVLLDIFEGVPEARSWTFALPAAGADRHTLPKAALAFTGMPTKYNDKGIMIDRRLPVLFRAAAKVDLPAGEYRLLLRSHNGARLLVDGRTVATTKFLALNGDGHEHVPELAEPQFAGMRPLPVGHTEKLAAVTLDAGAHVVQVDAIVGGKSLRPEVGELVVAIAAKGEPFRVLGSGDALALTDESWQRYADEYDARLRRINAAARAAAGAQEAEYWRWRHDLARAAMKDAPAPAPPALTLATDAPVKNAAAIAVKNDVDRFIAAKLADAGVKPAPLADDHAFLRRVTLDTVGVIPSRDELRAFLADHSPDRRARVIDRLLQDPRWADHWVGYWQDVLAENPGILKPKLNNTGPFRWWIYESFIDNKPIDRFVTELVMMEGSTYGGGPAGFALATQNDVPMAAKAHILGTAFLGVQMKCARCHDAPFQDVKQKDLFSVAAMLSRGPQAVPRTSTIPLDEKQIKRLLVKVTLKPGSKVAPDWPFDSLAPVDSALPDGMLRRTDDSREQLAALITAPANRRFAQVIVNRLWKRYMGYGIVEPVDDWDGQTPSHRQLLDYLAGQFMTHDYDLKHVARLILNSHAYQRTVLPAEQKLPRPEQRLFASPARRWMTAEQVVDSLFAAVGKPMGSEELNLDVDGRRPIQDFLNLGTPSRAWQFTSLSNERDRPSLSMPVAQSIIDVLTTFGWRETRQDPITVRDHTPTVLQPLIIANGVLGHRIATLSDDSAITALCLDKDVTLSELVRRVYLQVLSRPPSNDEQQMFVALLSEGFAGRINQAAHGDVLKHVAARNAVSWSNHLSAEANRIKLEMERVARQGDPPTDRLKPDWRQRAEDMLWALVNSPEFVFVP